MPVVSLTAQIFLASYGHLNCYQVYTDISAYGMLGYLPVCFTEQRIFS